MRRLPRPRRPFARTTAPRKSFAIAAVDTPLPMLDGGQGKIFVLADDVDRLQAGKLAPEPLVLHVGVGDCILVTLTNRTQGGPVSFHVDLLASDPRDSLGVEAGNNPGQSVLPGATRLYTYYAHPEVGETVALVKDWGDVLKNPGLGLYGAIVVGAAGTTYTDPVTGEDYRSAPGGLWMPNHPLARRIGTSPCSCRKKTLPSARRSCPTPRASRVWWG